MIGTSALRPLTMFNMSWVPVIALATVPIALLGSGFFFCRNGSRFPLLPRPFHHGWRANRGSFFFETLPPEIRDKIFDEAFGVDQRLHLRPVIPLPKPTSFMERIERFFTAVKLPSSKLTNLIVSKQWYAEGQTYFKPNAVYDLSDDHCELFFTRRGEGAWDAVKNVRHIMISHVVAEKFPFHDMPNLVSCVIRRSYSGRWYNPLMEHGGRAPATTSGQSFNLTPAQVEAFVNNPAERLMHIDAARFVRILKNVQNGTKAAGTHPRLFVQGVWTKAKHNIFYRETTYQVNLRTWEVLICGSFGGHGLAKFGCINPQIALENGSLAAVEESAGTKETWIRDEEDMMSE
ncbi:hypothetical protein LTR84_013175 [Exophiala bonariae]|uniref:Uncharacterized protein n=1 Tax=Exophiala bonariae TaxID=1690606 RepID=A0AAV9NHP3_9EURO|nr:hypothetical protein LTR84_013175 [Exophiala bonariae]